MSPLKKLSLAAVATVVAASLLIPAAAGAQRPGRDCDRNRQDPTCRFLEKRREVQDKQNGVTPACRAATNKYADVKRRDAIIKSSFPEFKKAIKKAKTDKKKKKLKKDYKKFKKQHKKLAGQLPGLKTSFDSACAGARVKPTV